MPVLSAAVSMHVLHTVVIFGDDQSRERQMPEGEKKFRKKVEKDQTSMSFHRSC